MKPELIRVINNKEESNGEYNTEEAVEEFKKWTKINFIFNKATVYYSNPEDTTLSKLPEYFDCLHIKNMDVLLNKKYYPTPLSQLIAVCFKIGEGIAYFNTDRALQEFTNANS